MAVSSVRGNTVFFERTSDAHMAVSSVRGNATIGEVTSGPHSLQLQVTAREMIHS